MQTVLLVLPMEVGDEVAVRKAHEDFPIEALNAGIGVARVVAFIGSGSYALELTVEDGFQQSFHRFLGEPAIQRLFDAIRPHVHDLPQPGAATADLPLATAMLLWQRGNEGDATTV